MKFINTKSYEELSILAANTILSTVNLKENPVIGLPTGSTPIGTYTALIDANRRGYVDFSNTTTFNLDEYCGLGPSHEQSYRYFMDTHLFNHINIPKENIHIPNGLAEDYDQECKNYEALIESYGGLDMLLLGIGPNGHIGFNEPDFAFHKETRVVDLTDSTIAANSRFFSSADEMPRSALTMGLRAIMSAKRLVFLAYGENKEDITMRSFFGDVTPYVPASLLQYHPDVTAICCFK